MHQPKGSLRPKAQTYRRKSEKLLKEVAFRRTFQGPVGEFNGETLPRQPTGLMTRRTVLSSAGRHT
ncbi:hypothetical protein R70199_07318 [Paraburkholderia domus]|nr:hypothetical protein R70199_07318 [Paraburkholderia domus]